MVFGVRVDVALKPGILDPQGAEIERALPALGYEGVSQVRVGKTIRLELTDDDRASAEARVREMCDRLLANPVIESYEIELEALPEQETAST